MVTATLTLSEEEFLTSGYDGYELVDGVPVEVPMSRESASIGGETFYQIRGFLKGPTPGRVFPQDTAFKAWPNRPNHFRKPDAMYFRAGRLPGPGAPDGVIDIAPDIAVEVVSPNDRAAELEVKVREYLEAGVHLVWVIYPELTSAYVHRADGSVDRVEVGGALSGEEILPGFELPLASLFPAAQQSA